jgi:outer membrane murein-binding lipoprotein Lpp
MVTVEQQLEELTAKVDKLSTGVDLTKNGVASLTKTVSKITDKMGGVDRWSQDTNKFAADLEAALQNLTSRVQALE